MAVKGKIIDNGSDSDQSKIVYLQSPGFDFIDRRVHEFRKRGVVKTFF